MASRIKGITIEIGGDTVGLESALKDVNKRTKEVQTELKDVERLLKFDPNNVELLAQRQELLTQAIQSSTDKLNQLRAAQSQVEEQFRSGQIGEEQYRAFRRELQAAEQQLQGYEQALADMNSEQQRVQQGTRDLQTLFDATGTSVSDYANVIGQRLVRAIQNGTATGRDLEYAFQRIGRQAIGAEGDIERLRTTLQSVDSGNSVQNIRRELQLLQSEAEQTAESVEGIGVELENVAGALVAGGGIAGVVEKALDTSSFNTKIEISMDIPPDSIALVKESVKTVTTYIDDQEAALEGVRRQWALNKDASDETNRAIVEGAAGITKAYAGVDFTELIQETNEIGSALGLSNKEALGLINSLLKAGFPPEQLDTIAEYGTQMKDTGFSAKEIQAIFEAGIDTKTWNIDNLNDGVKEARITMSEFGLEVDDAMADLLKKAGMSTKEFQAWGKAVAGGGTEGSKAMSEVVTWLDTIDNKELKNELAIKVFGTKWEDQGQNMISVFQGLDGAIDKTGLNVIQLDQDLQKINADPAVQVKQAFADVGTALAPTLISIAELISKIATWISENPKLAATITTIVTGLGILLGAIMALSPIVAAIATSATALGIGMAPLIGIIAGVAAGIAALIAIGVLLYKNWDEISAYAVELWGGIKDWFAETWESIKQGTSETWEGLKNWLSDAWESIKETASNVWNGIKDFFAKWWDEILAVFTGPVGILVYLIANNWDAIKAKTSEIWEGIKKFFSDTWNGIKSTFDSIVNSIAKFVSDKWNDMKKITTDVFNGIKKIATDVWNGIKDVFNNVISAIVNFVKTQWENIKNVTSTIFNAVKSTVTDIWGGIKSFFTDTIGNMVSTVKTKFQVIVDSVRDKMGNARDIVLDIIDKIKGFFDIDLYDSGKAIIQSAIDGLQSMKRKILDKVEDIVGAVRDFWPFSPAKRGPLSDIDKMDFAGPIGDSIAKAESPIEKAMHSLVSNATAVMDNMRSIDLSSNLQAAVSNVKKSLSNSAVGMANIGQAKQSQPMVTQSNQPITLTVNPAPVYLDGVLVGQIDFDVIETELGSRLNTRMRHSGVKK